MKTAAVFLSSLLLSAVAITSASAAPVRVKLTARISGINDPGQVLTGRLVIGQRVNGTYVYNPNTPSDPQFPGSGIYHPYAGEARMRFVTAAMVFENVQPTQGITIGVSPESQFSDGQFQMSSFENKPLADGSTTSISMQFRGYGNITQTVALPTVAPVITNYYTREIRLTASTPSGNWFQLTAQIEAAELISSQTIEISPADGSFVPGQHFDAALLLPRNSVVATAHATVNGSPLQLQYPGSCQLLPPNSEGKPAILCPAVEAAVATAGGAPIDWTVELTNGTVLSETATWQLAQ